MVIIVILCAAAWLGQALKDGANVKWQQTEWITLKQKAMNDKKKETATREYYITYSPEVIEQARKYALAMSEARSKQSR